MYMMKHPGIILKEDFLHSKQITISKLSREIGLSRSTLHKIIKGESKINIEYAKKLGSYFNMPARFWVMLQYDYDYFNFLKNRELDNN
jgi:antitoxin HigA-1